MVSSWLNMDCLRSSCSETASMTKSVEWREERSVLVERRWRIWSGDWEIFCLAKRRSRDEVIEIRAVSSLSEDLSMRITFNPAVEIACAIPDPIKPPPTQPKVLGKDMI